MCFRQCVYITLLLGPKFVFFQHNYVQICAAQSRANRTAARTAFGVGHPQGLAHARHGHRETGL